MYSQSFIYCLALYPTATNGPLSGLRGLPQSLQTLELLGEVFSFKGQQRYRLGTRFYQWLTFMGCAPALKLEADGPDDEKFCHFRIREFEQAVFRYLRSESRGRCPICRHSGVTAGEIAIASIPQQHDWTCPHCQHSCLVQEIVWKHEAGLGRYFLELLDVHPHEVIPTDSLLRELAELTGQTWQYCYAMT